ncbi:MAG: hypothetical protein ABIX28_00565 [Vicinamibacterales bacterium]
MRDPAEMQGRELKALIEEAGREAIGAGNAICRSRIRWSRRAGVR